MDGGKYEWRYTLARSTGWRVVVRLDDRQVFSVDSYYTTPQTLECPYITESDGPFSLSGSSDEQ